MRHAFSWQYRVVRLYSELRPNEAGSVHELDRGEHAVGAICSADGSFARSWHSMANPMEESTCFDELHHADERVAVVKRGEGDQRRDP